MHALSELAFARVGGDVSVGGNRDPGVELARIDLLNPGVEGSLGKYPRLEGRSAEADHERSRRGEKAASREPRSLERRTRVAGQAHGGYFRAPARPA
jgi:hypothetical protein